MENHTDNFETIIPMLNFDNTGDTFYFVQIIQRKKEHPELGSNSHVIKTYYINSLEMFEHKRDEIKTLCNVFAARAYIHLTPRSFERVGMECLKLLADYIIQPDFPHIFHIYDSACGRVAGAKSAELKNVTKRWVLDIDEPFDIEKYTALRNYLLDEVQPIGENKVMGVIHTKNGYHVITRPFDASMLNTEECRKIMNGTNIDLHKNNPTLLYC